MAEEGESSKVGVSDPLMETGVKEGEKCEEKESGIRGNMYLYADEPDERQPVARLLSKLADLNSLPPLIGGGSDVEGGSGQKGAELGTLTGVYLPCIQNIFGVILFIRMVWIVGTAGVPLGFVVVLICCMVTFATSISLSAIATNGIVPAGGSYFMISRALGPEFGGAVGVLFFLATGIAGAMYISGAVEIVLNYMAPEMGLFGDFRTDPNVLYHNIRLYGTILVMICGIIVYIGVKFVSKIAPIALVCVILSIFSIYGGIFVNYEGTDATFCMLGDRIMACPVEHCTKNQSDPKSLYNIFCKRVDGKGVDGKRVDGNDPTSNLYNLTNLMNQQIPSYETSLNGPRYSCDQYFMDHEPKIERAVPGIASGVLAENIKPMFREKGKIISYSDGDYDANGPKYANIMVDITTSFTMFVAIYFPSCTGIMAGSNRSGDLKDGQKSIPLGTIGAQLTTSFVYLSTVVLFGASFNNVFIRDKFGECVGGQLAVTLVAWPYPFLIVVGSLLSTMGAALQSLTSAPRLIAAIAADGIIPFLNPFSVVDSRGEPVRALALTLAIAEAAVIIGNLDFIAPILTMCFLMCYMFVNLACTLQSLLKTPNWRPRFKFYHWSFSLLGVILCLFVMFISSWYYALMAMFIAGCIYKYIEYRGAEKEWGDGIRGLALSAARFSLLRLEDGQPHTKNWRPQLLVLVGIDQNTLDPFHDRKILSFASQLKAGKGLTVVGSIIQGDYRVRNSEITDAKINLRRLMNQEKVKGFPDVLVSPSIAEGIPYFVQISGLGGLKPNTVILGWPKSWSRDGNKGKLFLETVRNVTSARSHALVIPKNYESWPDSSDKLGGTIDIWWIVLDGGLLMLIPFLLRQHRTWKNSRLRVFTVAQMEDNSIQMKKDLATWIYALRIEAEVEVVEMDDTDISNYTYEKTIRMEQRASPIPVQGSPVTPAGYGQRGRRESKTAIAIEELLKSTKGIKEAREALDQAEVSSNKSGKSGRKRSSTDSNSGAIVNNSSINEGTTSPIHAGSSSVGSGQQPVATVATVSGSGQTQSQGQQPVIKHQFITSPVTSSHGALLAPIKPDESNVRRMNTAVKLNEAIRSKSSNSKLVVLNLPSLPRTTTTENEHHYMEFLETLSEGLERVLFIRGAGREVITIYS